MSDYSPTDLAAQLKSGLLSFPVTHFTDDLQIRDGRIEVPTTGGLGIELDRERLAEAHALYVEHGLGQRDDAAAMQYLVPGWSFDPRRPCLVR